MSSPPPESANPSATLNEQATPSLDHLVEHFVAAKRALSATAAVYRANQIVSLSRQHVERRAVLDAKNAFIRHGLDRQMLTMQRVREALNTVGSVAQDEFETVIRSLDVANDRLQTTLASLRKTSVKPASEDRTKDPGATLYDFIDESAHTSQLDHLRHLIDSYNTAQATLHGSGVTLDQSLTQVQNALPSSDKSTTETDGQVSSSFYFLVDQATEMASLLQSLISHYDLCVTAVKHTEGGSEAARAATSDLKKDGGAAVTSASLDEDSLYRVSTADSPLTEEERLDMLSVLDTDAQQVSDVVQEIRDRGRDMESELVQLIALTSPAQTTHKTLAAVLDSLKQLSTTLLPTVASSTRDFRAEWTRLATEIRAKTTDLTTLAAFYENFVKSHAALLREVERRELVATKMRSVAERARRDLAALYAEDEDMRAQFLKDVGEFLPANIWPGLMTRPERWVVSCLPLAAEGDGADSEVEASKRAYAGHGEGDDDDNDDDDDDDRNE